MALPKYLIKKYGVSKKAWAVYRGKKSSGTKKRTKRANCSHRKVKRVARRRYGRRRSSRRNAFGSIKSLAGKAALGVGAGMVLGMVAPSVAANPLVRHGAAFVLGGPVAAVASFALSGGLGSLGLGSSSGNMNW